MTTYYLHTLRMFGAKHPQRIKETCAGGTPVELFPQKEPLCLAKRLIIEAW
jgi:hypothetical protein